jgi:hypothetical protein
MAMTATRERSKVKKATTKASKKAKAVEAAPEPTLAERERQHYQEIQHLEKECERLEADFKDKKATASASKSAWESAVSVLRATIRRGPDPQLGLQFGDKGETPADDFMREDVMDALPGLTGKQVDALEDAGVRTIGELEQLRAGAGLRSIKGFGPAIADKIEDMLLDFLAEQRRKADVSPLASKAIPPSADDLDDDEDTDDRDGDA